MKMDAAYSNVGLDANGTWREGPGDAFQKCSDKLWIKLNYLKEKKHHQVGEKGKTVTVRDVIPQSRLALYGNYPYDNDREAMYNREKSFRLPEERPVFRNEPDPEPWMLPEVEKKFIKLIRNCSRPYDLYNGFKPVELVEVEESIRKKYPVLAKKCQPGLVDTEETLETIRLPNPFYRIEDLNQLELQMRITSTKHVWERPLKIRSPFSDTSDRQPKRDDFAERSRFRTAGCQPHHIRPVPPRPPLILQQIPHLQPMVPSMFPEAKGFPKNRLRTDKGDSVRSAKKKSPSRLTTDRCEDFYQFDRSGFDVPENILKWLHTGYPTRCKEFQAIQNLNKEFHNVRIGIRDPPNQEYSEKTSRESSESLQNRFLDALARQTENLNVSRCSSSSSGRASSRKRRGSPFSNLTYSPISSVSLPGSAWSSKRNESCGSSADPRLFYVDNGYDDLEKQAIEQWPSDDSIDMSNPKRAQ